MDPNKRRPDMRDAAPDCLRPDDPLVQDVAERVLPRAGGRPEAGGLSWAAPAAARGKPVWYLWALAGLATAAVVVLCAALWQVGDALREQARQGNAQVKELAEQTRLVQDAVERAASDQLRSENVALKELLASARQMHRDAEWHLELINAVYSQNQQEEVVTMLATAYQRTGQDRLHLSPNELGGVLALNRGVALFSAQQFSAAEQAFRQAADTFSDPSLRIMSYFALGTTQKVLDCHADAIKTYQGIQRLAEGDPKWRAFLAMALHFEAWSHHAEAEKLKGKDPAQAQRLLDTASGLYDRALALVPEYAKIRYNRSLLLTLAADLADGRGEKEAAQRLRTQAAEELANAAEALKRRLTAHADDARAHFTFAMVCVRQKALDLALTHIEEAVRLDRSLALLVPTEEVFKPLQGRKEFQAILEKGKELGREVPGRNLFFDADLPMARPSERM